MKGNKKVKPCCRVVQCTYCCYFMYLITVCMINELPDRLLSFSVIYVCTRMSPLLTEQLFRFYCSNKCLTFVFELFICRSPWHSHFSALVLFQYLSICLQCTFKPSLSHFMVFLLISLVKLLIAFMLFTDRGTVSSR